MLGGQYSFEQKTLYVLRLVALGAPLFLALYGLLIECGLIHSDLYRGPLALVGVMTVWIVVGCLQFVRPAHTKSRMAADLIVQHVMVLAYVLLIAGYNASLLSAWVVLYLASYVYFSWRGFVLSLTAFVFTVVLALYFSASALGTVLLAGVATLATTLAGLVAVSLNRIREYDREEIAASRLGADIQRERMLTLVNNLADAIVSTDPKGVIQIYNAAFVSLMDTNLTVFGHSVDDIVPLEDAEGQPVSLARLLEQANALSTTDEYWVVLGEDKIRLELTYAPIRSSFHHDIKADGDDGYVIIFRDITKSKSLEEERDEFISVVSHELRTPIAVAEGSIDNARVILDKKPDDRTSVESSLETAHEQVVFLSRMVNDLSTLSRAERGVADAPEDIDVKAFTHELYREYLDEADKKGLAFELELGPSVGHVTASRLYLHELLQNFVTNAIKYTKEGRVVLKVVKQRGQVIFSVSDSGIGISKRDQAKIFGKFYRAEDYRTRETSGTGLGLYVAAKLAKKLGCTIEVASRLNHGSTFSFKLPVDKSA